MIALVVNMGAYTTEIMRAGIQSIQRTQLEAADCLGLTRLQTILHVVLLPAMERVYPALSSQFVLLMLASSITSQISAEELTATANLVQSDTYRSFEVYIIVAVVYLALSALYRLGFWAIGLVLFAAQAPAGNAAVIQLNANHLIYLARGGALDGAAVADRLRRRRRGRPAAGADARVEDRGCCAALASGYIQLIQGTPLLIVLFLSYFGLGIMGYKLVPLVAAGLSLTLYAAAFLGEIWRGCIEAVPRTQWEASDCLGLNRFQQYAYVILPQAVRIAIPPTVGFMVQIVKNTSLASVIGFVELARAGQIVNNSTFEPFVIFTVVAADLFRAVLPAVARRPRAGKEGPCRPLSPSSASRTW